MIPYVYKGGSMRLPEEFIQDMKELLGEEFDQYIASYDQPRWYGLRVNTNKISVEDFLKISPFKLTPIPWIENGFYYDGDNEKPGKHPYYFAGLYYLQEPSAMTPANHLPIVPGDRVLDLCAAPGGKTTELGSKLAGQGLLVSNDISNSRARILLKNQELMGLTNIYVMSENPEKMINVLPEYFDKILVDAPCSGEGMFRKDSKMVKSWEESGPEFYSEIQQELILQAAKMLKPGGMILYSTCTFSQEENEGTVAHLLREYPEFSIVSQKEYQGFRKGITKGYDNQGLEKSIRIWPQHMNGEGHYLALVKKNIDGVPEDAIQKLKQKKTKVPDDLKEFWKLVNFSIDDTRLRIVGEKVYYLPEITKDMKKLRLLRNGLLLGELKKNRFEPSQAFAMSLKKDEFVQSINFSAEDIRVVKYLKGETLEVEDKVTLKDKGWYLVCVDGYSLGFAKITNTRLKNKYSAGWRLQA